MSRNLLISLANLGKHIRFDYKIKTNHHESGWHDISPSKYKSMVKRYETPVNLL